MATPGLKHQGYPSPDTTGVRALLLAPTQRQHIRTPKSMPGASYKIIRKWTLINWCGTIITEHNQLIKVKNSLAPIALLSQRYHH